MGFKVGDRVVAIRNQKTHSGSFTVTKDTEYTVSHVGRLMGFDTIRVDDSIGIWTASGFRKVEPKKKSNSVTKELLEKFKETERELVEYNPEEINIPVES